MGGGTPSPIGVLDSSHRLRLKEGAKEGAREEGA